LLPPTSPAATTGEGIYAELEDAAIVERNLKIAKVPQFVTFSKTAIFRALFNK